MIESIRLQNFKAFKDISIKFRQITLLSGLNGSGKSTTLQAFALLRQSFDNGFIFKSSLTLNGHLVDLGVGRDVLHENNDRDEIVISLKENSSSDVLHCAVSYDQMSDVLEGKSALSHEELSKFSLFKDYFQYLKADRVSPMVSYPKSHHVISTQKFLGSKGEFAPHYLFKFQDSEVNHAIKRHPSFSATSGLLSQINAWMQEISPGARVSVEEVDRTDTVRLAYGYGSNAGIKSSELYRPTNVGFGLSYSLPILLACLTSPPGSLVLVENPEAHLHPQGQVALGDLLARTAASGVQIIVESHSDHILNGLRIAVKNKIIDSEKLQLNFFSRALDGAQPSLVTPEVDPTGRLSKWPDGFFDQWDKSIDLILG
ncbi:DUF3696 domain-containing protein [Methylobacterium sp. Leaf88]|uniref:AAA family ATPase n=1 Tax=Methylobacterium sp. Leaf88 TaxID=1736244 RepID=UPI0009E8EFA4|nr:DUF3696 domain-containing protein [Methylobacterium sp. Leaf88]